MKKKKKSGSEFSHWNYRIIRFQTNTSEEYFCVCETYYNEENQVVAFSDRLQKIIGTSKNDLLANITHMTEAFGKKILNGDRLLNIWGKNE